MNKRIVVMHYDSEWPKLYEKEASSIRSILGKNLIEIHHIGSTAVPGLSSKPIIDIILLVNNRDEAIDHLVSIGYTHRGDMFLPFREYFKKGNNVHLHLYEQDSPEVELNLIFRNYLRSHEDARAEYQQLKLSLLDQEHSHQKSNNRRYTGYNLGKDEFIRKIMHRSGFNKLRLMYCNHHKEWEAYYRIRNLPNNTEESGQHWYHFVFYEGVSVVAVAAVNFEGNKALVRECVALDHKQQMLSALKNWAVLKGKNMLHHDTE